jgi:predicted DNA binding CopG/RHH family protein
MKKYLDEEEAEILYQHKNDKLIVADTHAEDLQKAVKSAKNSMKRDAVLSIKLSEKDIHNLKLKELEVGVPYQNIVSALIHKYLENKIKLTL